MDALDKVDRGTFEFALVQGGIASSAHPRVRQVAALHLEALHLLVRPELFQDVQKNLTSLRGKTVNLSTPGSGTYELAVDVLKFAGLRPGKNRGSGDYLALTASYQEVESRIDKGNLPDAVFTVSALPSPLARQLITKRQYKLVSLPFGEAFSLEAFGEDSSLGSSGSDGAEGNDEIAKYRIYPTEIPAFTYGIEPPAPAGSLATLGTRLLLVANVSVPTRAVRSVLEAVFSSEFAHNYRPSLDPSLLDLPPEYPWHPGTEEYRQFHKPLHAGYVVDLLANGSSLAGAIAGALFFLRQWLRQYYRRKRDLGFESYMVKVAAIEQRALELEQAVTFDLKELLQLQVELNRLKNEALSRFAEGRIEGESLMSGFVAHVNDARHYLTKLILYERNNIENRAHAERRPVAELWLETLDEPAG